jgi:uncharacterized protein (DUF362 family)
MVSSVAVVRSTGDTKAALRKGLGLIGNIDDLNTRSRSVVIKPGIYDQRKKNHPEVNLVDALVDSFGLAPQVFIVESENYRGKGSERLQIYKEVFTERTVPIDLSEESNTREANIANEKIGLSHVLFKPNVFVSVHSLRIYERGTILKNLLGLIPERKKVRFHEKLDKVLLDIYEAIGGIDLAVLDGTYTYPRPALDKRVKTDILSVGRDAVAVEAVGADLVGMDPATMPVIREAMRRGLGEGDLKRIEVLGESVEAVKKEVSQKLKALKKKKTKKA